MHLIINIQYKINDEYTKFAFMSTSIKKKKKSTSEGGGLEGGLERKWKETFLYSNKSFRCGFGVK